MTPPRDYDEDAALVALVDAARAVVRASTHDIPDGPVCAWCTTELGRGWGCALCDLYRALEPYSD